MSNTNENNYYAVMLIDDNEIDNLINQKMIEASGISEHIYTHTGARSAIEFLKNMEKLRDTGKNVLPEMIFLDIDMPKKNGFDLVRELREYNLNPAIIFYLLLHQPL